MSCTGTAALLMLHSVDDAQIVTVDVLADDALLEQWVDASTESGRHEFGDRHTEFTADEVRVEHRLTTDYLTTRYAALVDDVVVGSAALNLPVRDNPGLAYLRVSVRPAHRRRGVGSALLQRLETDARAGGRSTLNAGSTVAVDHDDPAAPFAARHGYVAELVELRSDLDLPTGGVDDLLTPLEADAAQHTGAYDVLTWWDGIPDEWLDQRAHGSARMSTDAPSGGLVLDEESWDANRVREMVQVQHEQGRRFVETAAVHRATGQLAAFSDLSAPSHTPTLAYQWDTLVLKEHRGRRLGQLVKAANLRALLAELPAVTRIVTWNADVNAPMLRVNRAMGFVTVGVTTEWQKVG